jgi:hypothetical protein
MTLYLTVIGLMMPCCVSLMVELEGQLANHRLHLEHHHSVGFPATISPAIKTQNMYKTA